MHGGVNTHLCCGVGAVERFQNGSVSREDCALPFLKWRKGRHWIWRGGRSRLSPTAQCQGCNCQSCDSRTSDKAIHEQPSHHAITLPADAALSTVQIHLPN